MDLADRAAGSCSAAGRGTESGFISAIALDGALPTAEVCAAASKVKSDTEAIRE
jgi:hypothetical protein